MKDRIAHIIRAKNLKASDFATMLGIQPSAISHILAGRNNPSLEFVKKIKETFPEYNLDWIIFGTGPMTLSEPYRDSFKESLKESSNESFMDSPKDATLFDEESIANSNQESSQPRLFPNLLQNSSQEVESPKTPSLSLPSNVSEDCSTAASIKSIVIFYTDGTFESFISK